MPSSFTRTHRPVSALRASRPSGPSQPRTATTATRGRWISASPTCRSSMADGHRAERGAVDLQSAPREGRACWPRQHDSVSSPSLSCDGSGRKDSEMLDPNERLGRLFYFLRFRFSSVFQGVRRRRDGRRRKRQGGFLKSLAKLDSSFPEPRRLLILPSKTVNYK